MTVVVLDAFNRVSSDLTTSPSGRWGAPVGSGGTNAWSSDGQYARTATTFGLSTRGWLRWIGPDTGVNYGKFSASIIKASANVTEIGIFVRSHGTTLATMDRLALIWKAAPAQWELRLYSGASTYNVIATATDASTGFSWGTGAHTVTLTCVPVNCQTTPNGSACPNPAVTLALTATVDGIILFSGVTYPDYFVILVLSLYRGFGFEVLTAAGWTASDYVLFDDASFDSMITPTHEPVPALVATPTLTPVTITASEGIASSTLPYQPDVGEKVTVQWFTMRSPLEAGYQKTWAQFQAGRRLFDIGHSALHLSDCTALQTFLQGHSGPETPFTYVDDTGVSRSCFWTGVVDYIKVGVDAYRIEYVIEEAFP